MLKKSGLKSSYGDPLMNIKNCRPTVAQITLKNITANFELVKKIAPEKKIMSIVKANAYGHGIVPVSKHLESIGTDYLGVAFFEEGLSIRKAGIKTPVLVLGAMFDYQVKDFILNDLEITVSSIFKLQQVEDAAKQLGQKANIHLKIDTGMNRVGVRAESAKTFLDQALISKHIEIRGIYSHLIASEEEDNSLTKIQTEKFASVLDYFKSQQPDLSYLTHLANSGGVLYHPETHLDLVRPGAMLYGVNPKNIVEPRLNLRPVMEISSKVAYLKDLPAGNSVSYGATWTSSKNTKIITIPIGYGDGWSRDLSNNGYVLFKNQNCPVVGRVCMDNFMVDIDELNCSVGDEIVLLGKQSNQEIRIEDLARLCNTDPRELLTNLNERIPRLYL